MNTFGWNLKLTLFGEPNSSVIGAVLHGLPPGEDISQQLIADELAKQPPGTSETGVASEPETPAICSGLSADKTLGTPLCILLRGDSDPTLSSPPSILRPGSSDLVSLIRLQSDAPSGDILYNSKLIPALVAAGSVCKQILLRHGITIESKITQVGPHSGDDLSYEMRKEILDVRASGDSVGGIVTCHAYNFPIGRGGLLFAGLNSSIASMLFSIPGAHGVDFGDGFGIASLRGSSANDSYRIEDGSIITVSNHAGGIESGISNGMPIIVRCAFRPTPLIGREQQSVDLDSLENTTLRIRGRIQPCVVPKASLAVEAVVAFCLLDALI